MSVTAAVVTLVQATLHAVDVGWTRPSTALTAGTGSLSGFTLAFTAAAVVAASTAALGRTNGHP